MNLSDTDLLFYKSAEFKRGEFKDQIHEKTSVCVRHSSGLLLLGGKWVKWKMILRKKKNNLKKVSPENSYRYKNQEVLPYSDDKNIPAH